MANVREVLEFIVKGDAKGAIDAFRGVERAADGAEQTTGKFGGMFDKLTNRFPVVGKAASKFGLDASTAGAMAGTAATAAATAVGAFAVKSVQAYQEVAGQILQFQRVSGTSAEEASRWVEVAGDYGVSSDEAGAAIGRLAKNAATAPEKLAALGVQVAKNADGTTNLQETMFRAAEAFRTQTDQAKKAELGMALFGKSWQTLVPLLVQGSDGLAKSLDSVSDAKILDDDDLREAEEFRLALDDLKGVSEDLMIQVGKGLVPALKELAQTTKDVVGPIQSLTSPIGGIAGLTKAVTTGLSPLAQMKNAVSAVGDTFDFVTGRSDDATKSVEEWNTASDQAAERAGEQAKLNAVLGVSMEEAAEAAEKQAEADKLLADRNEMVADSAKKAADALDDRRRATEEAFQASRASVDPILRERAAQRDLAAAAKDVADKTNEAADAKFKDAAKNDEVVAAQDGLIDRLADVAAAYVEAKGKALDSREGAELYVAKLRELRDQYGPNLGPAISIYDELIRRIDETIRKQSAVAGVGTHDRPYRPPGGGVGVNSFGDGLPGGGFAPTAPGFGGAGMTVNVTLTAPLVTQQAAQWVADQLAVLIRTNGVGALPFTGVTAKV